VLVQSENFANHAADPVPGYCIASASCGDRETEAGVRKRVRADRGLEKCLGAPLPAPVDMFELRLVAEPLAGGEWECGDSLASGASLRE
jgi:hypothetical protein